MKNLFLTPILGLLTIAAFSQEKNDAACFLKNRDALRQRFTLSERVRPLDEKMYKILPGNDPAVDMPESKVSPHKKPPGVAPVLLERPKLSKASQLSPHLLMRTEGVVVMDSAYLFVLNEETGEWAPVHRYYHRFDNNVYFVEMQYDEYQPSTQVWEKKTLWQFEYNDKEQELKRTEQYWSPADGKWMNFKITWTTYNEAGNPVEKLTGFYNPLNLEWENQRKVTYGYSPDGQLAEAVTHVWQMADWVNTTRNLYTYTSAKDTADIISQTWDLSLNTWVNYLRTAMSYSKAGLLTELRYEWWNMSSWIPDYRDVHSYNAHGLLENRIIQVWRYDEVWQNYYQLLYTWNEERLNTAIVLQEWDYWGDSWVNLDKNSITYNEYGLISHEYIGPWEATTYGFTNDLQVMLEYNALGDTVSSTYQAWDTSLQEWVNWIRIRMDYDDDGFTSAMTGDGWLDSLKEWIPFIRYQYTYYDSGLLFEEIRQYRDYVMETWVNDRRTWREYNDSDSIISFNIDYWFPDSQAWSPGYQTLYKYGTNGMLSTETTLMHLQTEGWVYESRYTYSWFKGHLTERMYEYWETTTNQWLKYSRIAFTYGDAGKVTEYLYQYYYSGTDTWENSNQILCTYDPNGNLLTKTVQYWYDLVETWVNDYRLIYQYNEADLPVEMRYESWAYYDNVWQPDEKIILVYNDQNQLVEEYGYEWISNHWQYYGAAFHTYNSNGQGTGIIQQTYGPLAWDWMLNFDYAYYWSPLVVIAAPESVATAGLDCFFENPWPSDGTMRCEGLLNGRNYELRLYSTEGKLMYQTRFVNGMQLEPEGQLPMGMYILTLCLDNRPVYHRKVIAGR